jgi:hypothetical protein
MNKIRSSLPWPQLIFAFVVFIAMLVLAFSYQGTLRETVLVSILYVLWLGDLAIQSIDQRCIWQLALVITLVLTITFFFRKIEKSISNSLTTVKRGSLVPSRIRFWRIQVRVGSSAVYARSSRPSDLSGLVIKALAYHENMDIKEVIKLLRSQKLQVPPEVRNILGMDDLKREAEYRLGILRRIQQKFRLMRANVLDPTFSPDPRLDKVAEYLESLLEDEHDS